MGGVDKPLRAVGAVRAVRAEGVWAHTRRWGGEGGEGGVGGGGLGTHWKPLNFKYFIKIKTYTTRTKGRRR